MTQLLDVSPSSFLLRNEINRRCRWKRTDVIHGNLIGTCNFFNSWESIVKTEDSWIKRKSVSLIFLSHEYPFYQQNERGLGTRLIFHYQIPQAVEEPEIFWIPHFADFGLLIFGFMSARENEIHKADFVSSMFNHWTWNWQNQPSSWSNFARRLSSRR